MTVPYKEELARIQQRIVNERRNDLTGLEIAQLLRDQGFGAQIVYTAFLNEGYTVFYSDENGYRELFISDRPILGEPSQQFKRFICSQPGVAWPAK